MNPTGEYDRLHFSHLPTPLEPMDRLGRYLGGPHLFIKRDDCTGLATGGNSTRKLEFLMADAIAAGADVVITHGPLQSNHARQTAAIASKLNMQCALALENTLDGDDDFYSGSANVLLDRLFGADIHRFPAGFDMESATLGLAKRYEALGKRCYIIPTGGSNPIGALGYVNCAFEIAHQLREQGLRIDRLIHAERQRRHAGRPDRRLSAGGNKGSGSRRQHVAAEVGPGAEGIRPGADDLGASRPHPTSGAE